MNDPGPIGPFEELAIHDPDRLVELLRDGTLPNEDLTFAAEAAGAIRTDAAIDALIALTKHSSAVVREGVIYGLAPSADVPRVRYALETLWVADVSDGVRAAAGEALNV